MSTWPAASDAGDPVAVRHKTTTVDGLSVFYRDAGDPRNPTLVLLHGFPSSSVPRVPHPPPSIRLRGSRPTVPG